MGRKAATCGFVFMVSLIILNYLPGILPTVILCAASFVFAIVAFILRKQFKIPVFIMAISIFAASSLYAIKYTAFYMPMVRFSGQNAFIKAQIADEPKVTENNKIYIISPRKVIIDGSEYRFRGKITVFADKNFSAREFDIIEGNVKLSAVKNTGEYDSIRQNRAKDIYLNANPQGEMKISQTLRKPLYYYAVSLRKFIRTAINKYVPGEEGALTNAVVLGDKSELSQKTKDDFYNTGLSHALAVSGIHVSFMTGFILMLINRFGTRKKIGYALSIISVIIVMAVTGFVPSIMRASVMSIIMLFGGIFNQEADPLNSVGLTILILCSINPFAAVDTGFILSILATLGILLIASPLNIKIYNFLKPKKFDKLFYELSGVVSSTIGATVFTFPAILMISGNISIVSLPANILTVLPVSVCFMMGIFTALLSFFSPAAYIAGFITKYIAKYLIFVTSYFGQFSFASVYARNGYVFIWLLFVLLLIILYFYFKKTEKPRIILSVSLAVIVLCTGILTDLVLKKDLLKIVSVDVGNGDCFIIYKNNRAIVIDCGGKSGAYKSALNNLNAHNVKKIDVLIISHFHEDHAGYADELIENIDVEKVVLPPFCDDNGYREDIEYAALKNGATIYTAYKDMYIELPGGINIDLLTEHIDQSINVEDKYNNNSVVALLEYYDFSYLFTGDLEKHAENKLIHIYGNRLDCDILKVAHHGSATSCDAEFLAKITPEAAIISAGSNNYNHPSEIVIKKLLDIGAKIAVTKDNGNINMYSDGSDEFTIFTEK